VRPPRSLLELTTPAPLVDLDRLAHNLDRMAAYAAVHGLALRPHVKTHKSTRIAAEQLRLGATGLTCATPRELEVMSALADDLLFAHPPIGRAKLARLVMVPSDVRLTVTVDAAAQVEALADAARQAEREVGVYVEVDLGMHRVGVTTAEEAVALAGMVAMHPPLRYAGIAFYPGHIRQPMDEQDASLERLECDLAQLLQALDRAKLAPRVVSGGSTPAGFRMHEVAGITEVRPGTYVYNDRVTAELGACGWEDCAFTVLATVVSTAVPGQAVIDAGSKALGREPMRAGARGASVAGGTGAEEGEGFGVLFDRPSVRVTRMSEEHGILDLRDSSWKPEVGELVRVIPNHVCVAVHLNDTMYGLRNDEVVETSWPVEARGR
jgi:D-serine deaminase-like pyridoxal phosphate-dependent protein